MVRKRVVARVACEARVENEIDSCRVRRGELAPEQVRSVLITDALVVTGALLLCLPTSVLRQLGLNTPTSSGWCGPLRLWILGRDIVLDVMEVADGCPVLIGQIPLEHMQLVVDMANHRIAKSSANGGEWILDMF